MENIVRYYRRMQIMHGESIDSSPLSEGCASPAGVSGGADAARVCADGADHLRALNVTHSAVYSPTSARLVGIPHGNWDAVRAGFLSTLDILAVPPALYTAQQLDAALQRLLDFWELRDAPLVARVRALPGVCPYTPQSTRSGCSRWVRVLGPSVYVWSSKLSPRSTLSSQLWLTMLRLKLSCLLQPVATEPRQSQAVLAPQSQLQVTAIIRACPT